MALSFEESIRSDLQDRRGVERHECNQHRGAQVRAGMATQSRVERIVRVRHREDHASPFASCFAAPHPAGEMFREDASAGLGR